jgi:hypothetical protein
MLSSSFALTGNIEWYRFHLKFIDLKYRTGINRSFLILGLLQVLVLTVYSQLDISFT